jgi:outer membrane immunogenic protein
LTGTAIQRLGWLDRFHTGAKMKISLAKFCPVFILGTFLIHISPVRADDLGEVLKQLATLRQENAALRERVNRLEKRRGELSYPTRSAPQTKIVALAGNSRDSNIMYKAIPPTPASSFSWTGLYIGGHIGGGWQVTSVDDPLSLIVPNGTNTAVSTAPIRDFNPRGLLGGAQAGWNYQIAHLVIGSEISISWADLKGGRSDGLSVNGTCCGPPGITTTIMETRAWGNKTSWLGTATTRFGYAWDRWLAYTKGGIAASHNRYDLLDSQSFAATGDFAASGASTNSQTGTDTRIGWTVGAGLEWNLSSNWSVLMEYNYMDFGSKPVATFGTLSGFCTGACVGTFAFANSTFEVTPIELRIQMIRFGLNYRFGSAPDIVVANY